MELKEVFDWGYYQVFVINSTVNLVKENYQANLFELKLMKNCHLQYWANNFVFSDEASVKIQNFRQLPLEFKFVSIASYGSGPMKIILDKTYKIAFSFNLICFLSFEKGELDVLILRSHIASDALMEQSAEDEDDDDQR
ncbi:MAG: hypothetical protein EZS28_004672 [Streblomastix strix]|uniref:Uncharacterized protein n=1 Tax=Streblomastix strix TaxID=222440 RepID=A0A5J4X021_9EUKA|nr:MAG: hypothetical protein EZS28_004672 [Streblomastix strix]